MTGTEACNRGLPRTANPHGGSPLRWEEWDREWVRRDAEYRAAERSSRGGDAGGMTYGE